MGQVLGRDATARIRNPEDDLVISRRRAHRDPTASLRELDRVADEVLEHLKEPVPITPDLGNITAPRRLEAQETTTMRAVFCVSTASTIELTCR